MSTNPTKPVCPTCKGTGDAGHSRPGYVCMPCHGPGVEPTKEEMYELPCLECGKLHQFPISSPEARGIFNVFCSDKDCEDRYAFKQ